MTDKLSDGSTHGIVTPPVAAKDKAGPDRSLSAMDKAQGDTGQAQADMSGEDVDTDTPFDWRNLTEPDFWRVYLGRSLRICRQVIFQTYRDGFVLAGNFAYLTLLAIFPFFIIAATLGSFFGRTGYGMEIVDTTLRAMPPSVGSLVGDSAYKILNERSGKIIWLASGVGLWTTASLIESIRDIIRRAYSVENIRPFWQYRLGSITLIVAAVLLTMLTFSLQVMLSSVEQFIQSLFPFADVLLAYLGWSQIITTIMLFGTLYIVFKTLTPRNWRRPGLPIWPGPLFIALWWMAATSLLPLFITNMSNYNLTYGSLAGVMISLIFFFIIGMGMVIGAELNAVLARDRLTGGRNLAPAKKPLPVQRNRSAPDER